MVAWHSETLASELPNPHYLLFCDTHITHPSSALEQGVATAGGEPVETAADCNGSRVARKSGSGRWHFVLERLDGPERFEVADSESRVASDRLALLAVVRGLEALEQPSRVSLVTTSRYVSRGLKYGLETWRQANYQWERFGVRKPIRNADLWRRIDRALQFHGVNCKLIQPQFEPEPSIEDDRGLRPHAEVAARTTTRHQRAEDVQARYPSECESAPEAVAIGSAAKSAPHAAMPVHPPAPSASGWRQKAARSAVWLREKLDICPAIGGNLPQRTYAGT